MQGEGEAKELTQASVGDQLAGSWPGSPECFYCLVHMVSGGFKVLCFVLFCF